MVKFLGVIVCSLLAFAEPSVPRFEDYPAQTNWQGSNAPIRLATPSERMFRTMLSACKTTG